MAEDLVKQLQEQAGSDHVRGCQGRQYGCDCGYDLRTEGLLEQAAASLAAKDKEIERLRSSKAGGFAFWRATAKRFADARRAALSRADQAERALAEAIEVMRPFASDDVSDCKDCVDNDGKSYQSQWLADSLTAARAFIKEHGSDSKGE